ncbi:MAG: hypothetical protein ACYDAK_11645 [Candidatus Limnocylindrales bacterium]
MNAHPDWPPSRSTLLAGTLAAVAVAFGIGAVGYLLVPLRPGVPGPNVSAFQAASNAALLVFTPILGAFLVHRRTGNLIGWLFIHLSLWLGLGDFVDGLARHERPDPLIGWIAAVGSSLGVFGFVALILLVGLFPTGRLPSPRWRFVPVLVAVGAALTFVESLFSAQPQRPAVPDLTNPLARTDLGPILGIAAGIGSVVLVVALVGSLALLVTRFRRSRGAERQQLKWFAWAASIVAGLLAAAVTTSPFGVISDTLWSLTLASLLLLPVASTIAVLRYRLYDIDRIVSRTIGYATVTGVLVVTFVSAILLFQALVAPLTGGSTVAVAASTLIVAALFQPLRRRVQSIVDRRFNRSRYDAERTLATFSARLRDDVDLESLGAEISQVVRQTVAPASLGMWLPRQDARE